MRGLTLLRLVNRARARGTKGRAELERLLQLHDQAAGYRPDPENPTHRLVLKPGQRYRCHYRRANSA